MFDITTHLLLPYILASQAQKHVTHNEALRLLDAVVETIDAEAKRIQNVLDAIADGAQVDSIRNVVEKRAHDDKQPAHLVAFNKLMREGERSLTSEDWSTLRNTMSVGTPSQGGYTVMPEQMAAGLLTALDDAVRIRALATKFQVRGAASLGVVTLDADPADADWTTELGTGSEDSTMAFGKRQMVPNPVAKRIKVSNDLLRASASGATSPPVAWRASRARM